MNGFSPAWLALREPADLAARSRKVLEACERYFKDRATLNVCDMGAGTGASLRAFMPFLPKTQHWTLIDHDLINLTEAEARHADIRIETHDFARDPDCWPMDTELVTATALLDLTAQTWVDRFVAALKAKRLPTLVTLTVDGTHVLAPGQTGDAKVFAAFAAHQHRDKGFGPAMGGDAAAYLEAALARAGFTVTVDDSPWRITRGELMRQLLDGIAQAARETGLAADVDTWRGTAQERTALLTVGHRDVFAAP